MTDEERRQLNSSTNSIDFGPGVTVKGDSGDIVWSGSSIPGVVQSGQKVYKKADGSWTANAIDASYFSLGEDGAVNLTAPKFLYELPEFQQIFDQDTLKSYSAAYRTDPNYRVPYTQRNEDGTTEETQITIPEFVDKLNDALGNFVENYKIAEKNRNTLVKKYGDKANNFSLTQLSAIQSSGADSKYIYLPDFIFDFSDEFKVLKSKLDADGRVSAEDFMSVYNRGKVDQGDLAAIMAAIEGHLKSSDWGEDEVTFNDGTTMKNKNSANEAMKALALKNFILSKDPDAEWYQSVGDGLLTLTANAAKGFTSVFMNTLSFLEGAVTFGNSHAVMDATEDMNESFSAWNEERALIQDSTAVLATLGQIGGMIGGTVAEAYLLKAGGTKISEAFNAKAAEGLKWAENISNIGPSAQTALTAETMASILDSAQNISLGARFVMKVLPLAEKLATAKSVYTAFMEGHELLHWTTSFLIDTVHDAIVYDAVTLRHVIEGSSDQNMKDYWLGQLADNAKWWVGTGFAKTTFKFAGQTKIGEMLNAKAGKGIAKISVAVGDKKKQIKDMIYGGDVIRHLEDEIDAAKEGPKKNRLVNKLNQEKLNQELRDARRLYASLDLEREGLHLTDEAAEAYHKATDSIKKIENAIDRYGQDLTFKRQEMLGETVDPSTGRKIFVNPDLGGANVKAGRILDKLYSLTEKYNLKDLDELGVSQSIVDYLVGSYDYNIKKAIFDAQGLHMKEAGEDMAVISANLANLRNILPEKLISELDNSGALKVYTGFYAAMNDYGISKHLVDEETIRSYESNPIWSENGYMPIWKANDRTKWTTDSDTYQALVQRDIEHFEYNTKPGQHYTNPELVRQYRINDMAKTEVNQELRTALETLEDATGKIVIDGETTQRVKNFQANKKALERAISDSANGITDNMLITASKYDDDELLLRKLNGDDKNKTFAIAERSQAISSLSLDETSQILRDRYILTSKNPTLASKVTADNFDEWYDEQSQPVKNYLNNIFVENYGYDVGLKTSSAEKSYGKKIIDISESAEGTSEQSKESILKNVLEGENVPVKYKDSNASEIPVDFYPGARPTYEMFQRAANEMGSDFEAGLERAYLIGSESFSKSPLLNRVMKNIEDGKSAFSEGYAVTRMKANLNKIEAINTDDFVDEIKDNMTEALDNYVYTVLENPGAKKAIDAIANESGNGAELAGKYIALQRLIKDKKARQAVLSMVDEGLKHKGLSKDQADKIMKNADELWTSFVRDELNSTMQALRTTNSSLLDSQNVYKEVQDLANKISEADRATKTAGGDTIMYLDSKGRKVYAEVDPNYASLYNLRYKMSDTEASAFAKANAMMSKLFRYGTTTLNFSSFSNQLFRDTGNSLIVGGAWSTIKRNANNLVDVFGEDIVDQIKRFDPTGYEMKQVKAIAEQTGQSIEAAAVSRELTRGAAISPATTETTLYKDIMKQAMGKKSSSQIVDNIKTKTQSVIDQFDKVDGLMNGKREIYLRNRVYANNLSRALKQGYSLDQARTYATFAMNNATTNFSRQLYHLQAIGDSTPYFKAAINGTKSFWRMWSLDPVGISGRMMGGLILPTIFLTGASLGDPDNEKVYKNLPEYQKNENLVFVIDKQVVTIPIPQEMANIVSPFRQFVEYLHGANENDFWELMMSDVLGFSPVDLTAFSTIDMDKMTQDPTIGDRINRGFARVFSQVAPVPVKSAYMLVTGTDPYSGKNLYDPSYSYWDDETNSVQTMDYNQNAFAKWVANLWGKESNAAVLEKVISGIFGSTGSNALGEIVTLVEKGPGAAVGSLATDAVTQFTNPYSVVQYDQIDAVWKRAVRALTAEKDRLTSSKEFQAIYSELAQTSDEDKRKKLIASGQNMIKDYQNKVIETTKRLESVYQGTFDRKKFAAVMQLLNFNTSAVYQSGTQHSSDIAQEMFYEGRDTAISTMQALGVTGTKDLSIFGYLVSDDDGNAVMKYSSPVAIMDMKSAWMGAGDIDQANIEAKLKTDKIKTSDKWNGYYAAKAQGKQALKQYKSDWNAKVVKSLAPYISERGVNSIISNSASRDILEKYLFVDNPYQVKAYLKKIFENE